MKKIILFSAIALLVLATAGCEKKNESPIVSCKGKSDAIFNPNLQYGTMTDIDGNEYKTIKIGNQTWMAQNLRVTHYRNGDHILFDSISDWSKINKGVYCTPYNTTNLDSIATYGLIYNGHAVKDVRNIAPKGWRIPNRDDAEELYEYIKKQENVGDRMRIGGRLKEVGINHWINPNVANNSSGFTLLPTPSRLGREFNNYPNWNQAFLFTSTCRNECRVLFIYGAVSLSDIQVRGVWSIVNGCAIRCIKEN